MSISGRMLRSYSSEMSSGYPQVIRRPSAHPVFMLVGILTEEYQLPTLLSCQQEPAGGTAIAATRCVRLLVGENATWLNG